MLVLEIKKEKSFTIGDGIKVTVLDVYGDKARIGIDADPSIPIVREDAKNRTNKRGVLTLRRRREEV